MTIAFAMNKKIIQITANDEHLFALCEDGSVWFKSRVGTPFETDWKKII